MLFEDDEASALNHILNRHVPAMRDGFTILTKAGEMHLHGKEALKVQALIAKMAWIKLQKIQREQATQGTGAK